MKDPKLEGGKNLLAQVESIYKAKYFSIAFAMVYLVVVGSIALLSHKIGNFGVETDFYWGFAPQAKALLHGNLTLDPFHGPLYPVLLALVGALVKDLFTSGIIISLLSASAVIYLVFELVKTLSSADVAFLATALVAVNRTFVEYSYTAGTDMLFAVLALAGLYLVFRKSQVSVVDLVLSAALLALSYLVRYNGIVFLIAVPLVILIRSVEVAKMRAGVAAAVWCLTFILLVAPWSIYLELHTGSLFYDKNYQNVAYELFANGKMSWDQFWFQSSAKYTSYWDVIAGAPGAFVEMLVKNLFVHLYDDFSELNNFLAGLVAVIGGIMFARSRPDRRRAGFVVVFALFFMVLLTVYYSDRFSLLLLPVYSYFAAFFFKAIFRKFGDRKRFAAAVNIAAVILVLVSYTQSYAFNYFHLASDPDYMLLIKDWFNKQYGDRYDGSSIAARKPHLAYLLNMKLVEFPMVDNYDSLIAVLHRDSVKFLYYGDFEERYRPQFFDLFKIYVPHPGLKSLCVTRTPPSVLYELTK